MNRGLIFYDIVRTMAPISQVIVGGDMRIGKAVELAARYVYGDSEDFPEEGDLNALAVELMDYVFKGKPAPEWLKV